GYNSFFGPNGEVLGIVPDIARELADRTHCKLSVDVTPPARVRAMGDIGNSDIIALAAVRNAKSWLYVPLLASTTDLVVSSSLHIRDAEAARHDPRLIFGRVAGLYYGEWGELFVGDLQAAQVDESPNVESLYRKLKYGRVNATIGFPLLYLRNLDLMDVRRDVEIIHVADAPRTPLGLSFAVNRFDAADLALLSRAANDMLADGALLKILSRWVDPAMAKEQLWHADRDTPLLSQRRH
ncbi:MAG: transporter substrate-binding domain-containing protein, partial [Burkholderiales bacterium]|nr:transporter substrate-binding domain-containing protein [Burkholderiales bacterium]